MTAAAETLLGRFGRSYRITRRHVLATGATVVIAAAGVIGGSQLGHNPTTIVTTTTVTTTVPPAGLAMEWVDTNGGACVHTSAATPYVDANACGTYDAAYAVSSASCGDTIRVAPGSYPGQTITKRSKGSCQTNFIADPATLVNGLTILSSYVSYDGTVATLNGSYNVGGLDIEGTVAGTPTNVTVSNFKVGTVFIKGSHLTLAHGFIGPFNAAPTGTEDGIVVGAYATTPNWTPSDHILIDDVTIHDISRWLNPACGLPCGSNSQHTDGMQMYGCVFCTIQNSHIYRNATSEILVRPSSGGALDHILVKNTETGDNLEPGGNDVMFGSSGEACYGTNDIVVENSTMGSLRLGCGGAPSIARNNLIRSGAYVCSGIDRNATWTYNSFGAGTVDATCVGSTGTRVCNATFVDASRAATGNYDLDPSDTCAKGHGGPTIFQPFDIHGDARVAPQDIGADVAN
jgi:hypothetical protein